MFITKPASNAVDSSWSESHDDEDRSLPGRRDEGVLSREWGRLVLVRGSRIEGKITEEDGVTRFRQSACHHGAQLIYYLTRPNEPPEQERCTDR